MKKYAVFIILLFFSCGTSDKKKPYPTITQSTEVNELGKFLDFTQFKPTDVSFRYTYYDNSGQNDRSVPGPSDHYMQALMFFDSLTFKNILLNAQVESSNHPIPNYQKEEFNFDWLDREIKNELMRSDTSYHGHHDLYFGSGGQLWLMDKKILLYDGS